MKRIRWVYVLASLFFPGFVPFACSSDGDGKVDSVAGSTGTNIGGSTASGVTSANSGTVGNGGSNVGQTYFNSTGGTLNGTFSGTVTPGDVPHWVMGYYAAYQASEQPPSEIDWTGMSHITFATALANSNGALDLEFYQGSVAQGASLAKDVTKRAHDAGIKAILMIGGAGNGSAIQSAVRSNLSGFVTNLIDAMNSLGFDGIDLDWEDDVDMPLFIELAKALRIAVPNAILTVPGFTVNANYQSVDANLPELVKYLNQYNLMSYYPATAMAGGGWLSWHNCPLDGRASETPVTIADSFQRLVAAGVPKEKLGMGVAFYAICYTGSITAPNQDTSSASIEGGDNEFPVSEILSMNTSTLAASRKWDAIAQVPYLSLNAAERHGCRYVSYDDEQSLIAKGTYAKKNGYGGIIIWTISQGYMANRPSGQRNPLMQALKQGFLD